MDMRKATIGILMLLGLPGWVHAEFEWRGNNNNNWDNSGNWAGQSGWPDATNHDILLKSNPNRFDLDLRGGDRDVRNLAIGRDMDDDYVIESNTGGQGVLRINGNFTAGFGLDPSTGTMTFADSIDVVQAADALWSVIGVEVFVDSTLSGSSQISLFKGSYTLNAANPFSGEMHLIDGALGGSARITLGHADALANALVTIDRNFGLNVVNNGIDANVGALAGIGNLDIGSQTVTVGGNDLDTLYSGDLSGTGDLVKVGAGNMTLSGDNTGFTGTVTIGDGVSTLGSLTIGGDNALINHTVNVRTIDGLEMGGADRTIGGLTGGGDVYLTHQLSVGNNNSTTSHGGIIQGVGSLEKIGTGTLTLTGISNSYTGGTVLTDGTLAVVRDDYLGDVSGGVTFDGGTLSSTGTFTTDRQFDFADAGADGTLHVSAGETLQIDSSIVGTAGNQLNVTGPGTLALTGSNSGLGTLHNSGGGDLNIDADGGTFELSGDAANAFFVSGSSSANIQNGTTVSLTGTGGVNRTVLTHNAILSIDGNGSSLVTPRLDIGPSGAGSAEVIVQSGGAIQAERIRVGDLGGDNGALGTLTIGPGSDVVADETAVLRRGTINISGGTLTTNTLSDVDSPNSIWISDPVSGSALTVGSNNGNSLVDALIEDSTTGSGSIRKVGTGTLELTQANGYSGDTFVDGGTLIISNAGGHATGLGSVHVGSGATLAGTGSTSSVDVSTGGTVAPGGPTGVLVAFDATFEPGTILAIGIGGLNDFSQLYAPGPVNLNGTLDLTYLNGFSASPGDSFRIVDSGDLFGTFDTINFPDDQTWYIKYNTNTDNVIVGICADADSDGVCDEDDVCDGFDDNLDTDSDNVPDGCDACPGFDDSVDIDTDGVADGCDACPGFDDNVDSDSNGIPDGCEVGTVHNRTQGTDHLTIQDAIDASSPGDLIEADPGTYFEAIQIGNEGITLQSTSGNPLDTIIDANGAFHAVECTTSNLFSTSKLRGFTLTGGNASGAGNNGSGGGLHCRNSVPFTVRRCIIRGNTAQRGGGIGCDNSSNPTIVDCLIIDNVANEYGGALWANISSDPKLANSTLARNVAGNRGGGIASFDLSNPRVANCIVWGNSDSTGTGATSQLYKDTELAPGNLTVTYSNVMGGANGAGNIDADPSFVDADGADDTPGTSDDNLQLLGGSPCIDAAKYGDYDSDGDVVDLNGDPRTHDDVGMDDTGVGTPTYLDMGAFEFQGTTECGTGGDFGNDGDVDLNDYARFADCVNGPSGGLDPNCACFDLDDDGDVDTLDFANFQVSFTGN